MIREVDGEEPRNRPVLRGTKISIDILMLGNG